MQQGYRPNSAARTNKAQRKRVTIVSASTAAVLLIAAIVVFTLTRRADLTSFGTSSDVIAKYNAAAMMCYDDVKSISVDDSVYSVSDRNAALIAYTDGECIVFTAPGTTNVVVLISGGSDAKSTLSCALIAAGLSDNVQQSNEVIAGLKLGKYEISSAEKENMSVENLEYMSNIVLWKSVIRGCEIEYMPDDDGSGLWLITANGYHDI